MRLHRTVRPLLIALALGACDELADPTNPSVPFERRSDLTALATHGELLQFLPPHTMIRETGRPETIHLTVADLDFSQVMEPFMLRVRTQGGSATSPVIGSVVLDGATLLGPGDLATANAFDREIPLEPTSSLSVQLVGPPGSQLTIWIDATPQPPPIITITSPARGAMLMQGTLGVSPVEISGQACHVAFAITALEVNGVAVPVSGDRLCEPFTVGQDSRWGMSIITAHAKNARGREANIVQSYLRSPSYLPASLHADPAARVPAGARGQLGQALIDDSDRGDVDDLATLVERSTDPFVLNAFIPNPLLDQINPTTHYDCTLFSRDNFRSGFRVSKNLTVSFASDGLSLTAQTDGLHVSNAIRDIEAPVTIEGFLDLGCLGNPSATVNGTYTASRVTADLRLELAVTPAGPDVLARTPSATLSGASFDPDMGVFEFMSFLVNPMLNAVLSLAEQEVEEGIGSYLNLVPRVLESLFARYTLASDVAVNGVPLRAESVLDHLSNGAGALRLGVAAQVRPATLPAAPPATAFGPIKSGGASPALPAAPYATSLSDDLVNQLLWSAWQGGAFQIADVAAYTGTALPGLTLSLQATLPAVVMPGSGAQMVDAGIGDLRITGTVDPGQFGRSGVTAPPGPVPFEAYASVAAGLTLGYATSSHRLSVANLNGQVSLDLSLLPRFIDQEALAPVLSAAIQATIARLLPEAIAAVPLPILDLTGLPGLPSAFLRVGSASLARMGGFTILSGNAQ